MAAGVLEDKPLLRQGHPEHVVQDYIQMAFKYLKRGELHYLSGQPFPGCLLPESLFKTLSVFLQKSIHPGAEKKRSLSSTFAFSKLNHRFVLLLHGLSCSTGTVGTSPLLLFFLTVTDT